MHRAAVLAGDDALAELEREVVAYPNIQTLPVPRSREAMAAENFLVPCILQLPTGRLSMFTTLTTFGTPRDITLDELCVELFYACDEVTEQRLRQMRDDLTV